MNQSAQTTKNLTNKELFEIFPEGKKVIREKIREYELQRSDIIAALSEFQQSVRQIALSEEKDEFFIWFWTESYIENFYAQSVVEIDRHLNRLRFQKSHLSSAFSALEKTENWSEMKERAKRFPLEELASPYLERVRQQSTRIYARCPFHEERTASFVIYTNQNTFHCFGCGQHGDNIDFIMKKEQLQFADAIRRLSL